MKLHSLRVAVALTAALTTAVSPVIVSAQTAYEYKAYKQGLVVTGTATAPAPGPVTPPPPSPQPALQLSTSAINFGQVATNTTETRQVLVSNTGTGSLSFTAVPAVTGAAEFSAGLTSCGTTLAAGADCLADATFSPTAVGTYNGVLTFTSVLAGSPHEVSLVGTAFNPVSLAAATLPAAKLGVAYTYDFKQLLAVSNEASPDKSLATWQGNGTLPTGLSFNTGTGVLSGTPSVLSTGAEYTVTGTYKNNQGQQVYTIKVGDAVLEVVQISAGGYHTCAVTTSGAAKCWGYNASGQLGDGTTTNRFVPITVSGLTSGVASVVAGDSHTCAVTDAGAAKCWGSNDYGKLGDGTTSRSLTPVSVLGLTSGVLSLAAGTQHTCAVTAAGAAKCWGQNASGQVGDGTLTTNYSTPMQVSGLTSGVVTISASGSYSCVVTTNGAAKCWGVNANGELGDGTTTRRSTPTQVSGLSSGVASISTGGAHTCVGTTSGAARCWGWNYYGQLGDGSTTNRLTSVQVSGLTSGVTRISAGSNYTCAIHSGAAKCWGYNGAGQLGNGSTGQSFTPTQVSGMTSGVSSIATGSAHTCAFNSEVGKCWGAGGYGRLGDGTGMNRSTPVNISP